MPHLPFLGGTFLQIIMILPLLHREQTLVLGQLKIRVTIYWLLEDLVLTPLSTTFSEKNARNLYKCIIFDNKRLYLTCI